MSLINGPGRLLPPLRRHPKQCWFQHPAMMILLVGKVLVGMSPLLHSPACVILDTSHEAKALLLSPFPCRPVLSLDHVDPYLMTDGADSDTNSRQWSEQVDVGARGEDCIDKGLRSPENFLLSAPCATPHYFYARLGLRLGNRVRFFPSSGI